MSKILLTRSFSENELAAKHLEQVGFSSCLAPMINYKILPYDFAALPRHTIITSKYAARLVAENYLNQNGQVCEAWVIGNESAAILQTNKNIKVTGVAKDLKNLIHIISMIPENEAAEFFVDSVYLSGNIITQNLPEFITRKIIYEVSYAKKIPDDAASAIKSGEIKYIMIFSKNSAINLIKLFKSHNLLPYIKHSAVIGISRDVAPLFSNLCAKILYSELPDFSGMLKILIHEQSKI